MLACRPMLCFALSVMAGTITARFHPAVALYLLPGWTAFVLLALWFVLTPRKHAGEPCAVTPPKYRASIIAVPGFFARRGLNRFILLLCLAFFLAGAMRQGAWRRRLAPERLPEKSWFNATFVALAPARDHEGEEGSWRVPALLLTADGERVESLPVLLSGPAGQTFRRGDIVSARVHRRSDAPKAYPGAFDARLWLERDGLVASLSVAAPRRENAGAKSYVVTALDSVPATTWVRRRIDSVRAAAIRLTLEWGGDSGGMLVAMLYGYRKEVGAEIRDTFRRTGIGHVLAISGLHVGLIVGLLWWLSGWLGWSSRWRALACLVLAAVYLGLSGGQVAAARATVMAMIHLGGIAAGRKSDMMNSLGAAAFLLALVNPSAPVDVSFQLSFTAVVFIYLALDRGSDRNAVRPGAALGDRSSHWRRHIVREASSLFRLSVSTWVGLFPIVAIVFNQANLVGIPVNIVIIPLMALVLAGGLLIPCVAWIPGLGWLAELPSRCLTGIAVWADALPGASVPVHAPPPIWVVVFYLFVFVLLLRGMVKTPSRRRWYTAACLLGASCALAGMLVGMASRPPPKSGRMAVLPGPGMGVIAAEAPDGAVALIGTFVRGGLNEAGWLHYLRRGGGVSVVAVGDMTEDGLSALSYHYPLRALVNVPFLDEERRTASPEWLEVAAAPGIQYAVSRDRRGRIIWLAARTGGKSVCLAPRLALRQWTWRLERGIPGFDADLFSLGFSDRDAALPVEPAPRGRVGLSGRYSGVLPHNWFERRRYGVLMVEDDVSGFDGDEWVEF